MKLIASTSKNFENGIKGTELGRKLKDEKPAALISFLLIGGEIMDSKTKERIGLEEFRRISKKMFKEFYGRGFSKKLFRDDEYTYVMSYFIPPGISIIINVAKFDNYFDIITGLISGDDLGLIDEIEKTGRKAQLNCLKSFQIQWLTLINSYMKKSGKEIFLFTSYFTPIPGKEEEEDIEKGFEEYIECL